MTVREKFYPMDWIALVSIVGYIALLFVGQGKELSTPVAVIIGFYFGARTGGYEPHANDRS